MSTISLSADQETDRESARRLWIAAGAAIAAGALVFGLAFWTEIVRAVYVWDDSTAYNHCFLIIPISAYLIWERRAELFARLPAPDFRPFVLMIPVGLVWLLAERIHIMEGRQLMAIGLFELFLLAVLGVRAWRVIAFALLYLVFLVPVGAFLTPKLQDFAMAFAVHGIELIGIPVFWQHEGMLIEVPGARFTVAEACAGLRFLIASIALGALYGYLMYRSWSRRAAFLAASIIVPIIANGMRVMGIVVLGYILDSAQAAAADHLIYGWVFFSLVSLLLILAGLPFRQPMAVFPSSPADHAVPRRAPMMTAGVVALFAVVTLGFTSPLVTKGPLASAIDSGVAGVEHALGR